MQYYKIDGMPVVRISQIITALKEKGINITYGSIRWAVLSGKLQYARYYPKNGTRVVYVRYFPAKDFIATYQPQKAGRKKNG